MARLILLVEFTFFVHINRMLTESIQSAYHQITLISNYTAA